MKKVLFYALLLAIAIQTVSCDRSDNIDTSTSQTVTSGSWRVSLYTDSGNDETSDFAGYSFVFNTGGTVTATKNGVNTNGTWTVDNSSNKFIIDLGPKTSTNRPLGELTDDWKIISTTATQISLRDDNTTSNEYLKFTKN